MNSLQRIATFAVLKDRDNFERIVIFVNTHFDHIGAQARRESANIVLKLLDELSCKYGSECSIDSIPLFLTGDFNDTPNSEFYKNITINGVEIQRHGQKSIFTLSDASKISSRGGGFGPQNTFTGFSKNPVGSCLIDFIFVNSTVRVLQHYVVPHDLTHSILASDHLPVVADVYFQ